MLKDFLTLDSQNYLYLLFLKPILYEMNKINLIFQKDFLEIDKAFEDVQTIIMFLAAKIFKPVFLNFNDVVNNITNDLALLDTNNIELGIEFNLVLNENKISTQDLINMKDLKMDSFQNKKEENHNTDQTNDDEVLEIIHSAEFLACPVSC